MEIDIIAYFCEKQIEVYAAAFMREEIFDQWIVHYKEHILREGMDCVFVLGAIIASWGILL